ncbi:hypothetical protein T484DRAFT_1785913 [Baffinella frigidus]|nr:hypothetical protein T484DRAFT_1785913 [Cryptophyta sp. CCMP2293]
MQWRFVHTSMFYLSSLLGIFIKATADIPPLLLTKRLIITLFPTIMQWRFVHTSMFYLSSLLGIFIKVAAVSNTCPATFDLGVLVAVGVPLLLAAWHTERIHRKQFLTTARIAILRVDSVLVAVGVPLLLAAWHKERIHRKQFLTTEQAQGSETELRGMLSRLVPPMCIDSLLSGDEKSNMARIHERSSMARIHEKVTILFLMLNVGHAGVSAEAMVEDLNILFVQLDDLVAQDPHAFKVETVGGDFIAAAGVPDAVENHAQKIA